MIFFRRKDQFVTVFLLLLLEPPITQLQEKYFLIQALDLQLAWTLNESPPLINTTAEYTPCSNIRRIHQTTISPAIWCKKNS